VFYLMGELNLLTNLSNDLLSVSYWFMYAYALAPSSPCGECLIGEVYLLD